MTEIVSLESDPSAWHTWHDPLFALCFAYPEHTPTGIVVEFTETHHPHMHVMHAHTTDRTTIYFELAKIPAANIDEIYQTLQSRNAHEGADLLIGSASAGSFLDHPSLHFALQRGELIRQVILLQYDVDSYRITYDPRSPLNLEILATVAEIADRPIADSQ